MSHMNNFTDNFMTYTPSVPLSRKYLLFLPDNNVNPEPQIPPRVILYQCSIIIPIYRLLVAAAVFLPNQRRTVFSLGIKFLTGHG